MGTLIHPDRRDNLGPWGPTFTPTTRSTASLIAMVLAVGSFVLAARGHAPLAMLCALFAIGGGFLGGLRALSRRVTGGILSIIAIILGVLGFIAAILALFV